MRNAQLSASNLTSSLDHTCQSCSGGCGCSICQSVTIGCCGNHSTDYPGSACDACAVLADQQAELTALRQQVADMLIEFAKFQTWRQIWEPVIQALAPTVEAVKLDVDGLRIWAASIKDCLDCLCKTVSYSDPIEYMIDPAKPLQNCFTPNVNKWLQFPLRMSDLNPAAVRLGALWSANLPGNKYDVALRLELPPINYCNGCKVWVEQVACGVRTRVYEQTMMAGLQPLTINWTGQIIITSPCPDLHYEIGTDTNLGMPAQYCVESGSISFTPCTNF
jgi:hypothetical protein